MKMTTEQYETHQNENSGFCKECDEITTDGVEPDAMNYECSECGNPTVVGMDMAIMYEHIEIDDDPEGPKDDIISWGDTD